MIFPISAQDLYSLFRFCVLSFYYITQRFSTLFSDLSPFDASSVHSAFS